VDKYCIRELKLEDAEAYLACHRKVFGESGTKSVAEFEWLFALAPLGLRAQVVVLGETIVAAYAGWAQRTWIGGKERVFVHLVDSMVDSDHRRGLERPGLYVEVGRRFFDEYAGQDRDVVHFGWPMNQALRIGRRFLDYGFVREELALVCELGGQELEVPGEVESISSPGEQLKWLWDRCAGEWGAATIRDAEWARWRFAQHPRHDYELLGVRREGILRGLAVLRRGAWIRPGTAPLCDWLVPEGEPEVALWLERAIRFRAAEGGFERVTAVFPEWSSPFALFQELGWRIRPTSYLLTARSFDQRFDLAWLRENWWYTLADSDLV
jgi:hypothetical protein